MITLYFIIQLTLLISKLHDPNCYNWFVTFIPTIALFVLMLFSCMYKYLSKK